MEQRRIPRPKGLTLLARQSNKNTRNQKEREKIIKERIIQEWLNQHGYLNETFISIQELSTLYMIPIKRIHRYIASYKNHMGEIFNKGKDLQEMLQISVSHCFSGAFEDKMLAYKQLQLLLKSQGDAYKPFISAEVNQSLKTLQAANVNIMGMLKMFMGTDAKGTTINIMQQNNQSTELNQYVTPDKALELIEQKGLNNLKQDEEKLKLLATKHNLIECPEVAVNAETEANTSNSTMKDEAVHNALHGGLITNIDFEELTHDNRREAEYGIPSDDDSI